MDPGDFVNSSETRLAVSRVITWTTEPKSSDVRKVCVVLFFLFCTQVFRGLCSAEDQTPINDLQCTTNKYEHLRCVSLLSTAVWRCSLHSKRVFEPQQTPQPSVVDLMSIQQKQKWEEKGNFITYSRKLLETHSPQQTQQGKSKNLPS